MQDLPLVAAAFHWAIAGDSAINQRLHKQLKFLLNGLASHEYKDFHPNSSNKVRLNFNRYTLSWV